MKLQNKPIPFTSADIDRYMRPLLYAAVIGDLAKVPLTSVVNLHSLGKNEWEGKRHG